MSQTEGAIASTPDVNQATTSESASAASSTAQPTDSNSSADVNLQSVQEAQPSTQEDDVLAGFPPESELEAAVANKTPFAEMAARIKGAYEPLKTQFSELQERHKVFENFADKFTAPEEVQQLVDMREALLGWEQQDGKLVPSTQKFISQLDPQRAEFLFADLADGQSVNGEPRMHRALQFIASDPERRADALRILGAVEPSAVAPQWQATEAQLDAIALDPANPTPQDKELQEIFRSLPYDEREQLAINEPEFIRRQLGREKLTRQLEADKQQTVQRDQQAQQQREQLVQQEASRAGDTYVDELLTTGLTTFHNSVVEQCNFIEPLDLGNLPQGMSPEQAGQMNAQIAEANKAEAAQITAQIVALINPQTRRYMLPTLKETGVVDDKMMELIDKAAEAVGNNGRNYGNLMHRGKLQANGNGYQPGADVVPLGNEAQRNFKLLVHYANQIKGKLMERRSQFFAMKATGHNNLLGQQAVTRPGVRGSSYDPTTAALPEPSGGKLTRAEIDRIYG